MTLTGLPLFVLIAAATVLVPMVAAIAWRSRLHGATWLPAAGRFGVIMLCQLLAVGTAFLWVNTHYGFYTSWSDLTGRGTGAPVKIQTNGLTDPATGTGTGAGTGTVPGTGTGTVQALTVAGQPGTNGSHQVLVWLPPQYQTPSAQTTRFPVVMMLPGQPATPESTFRHFKFAQIAADAINSGRVRPFVAVFPPLMTTPPRDTECTNVPGGPQAETWLSRDVYRSIRHTLRVSSQPWTIIGWSTGGFCAAKLLLHDPAQYRAAASLGGYYQPLTDHTTGDLFHGSAQVLDHNSPTWLYQHGGLHQRKLLLVDGRQDRESYSGTAAFLKVTRGDANVSSLIFPTGGHNYHNYRGQLPTVLEWLNTVSPR